MSRIASPGSDKILDYDGKYSKYVKYKGQTHILQHPKDGMVSEGYLRYYSGDKLLKEVKIRNDRYAPQRIDCGRRAIASAARRTRTKTPRKRKREQPVI